MFAVWQVAILYKRRLMHNDAAGIATDMPTIKRVAGGQYLDDRRASKMSAPTDITK